MSASYCVHSNWSGRVTPARAACCKPGTLVLLRPASGSRGGRSMLRACRSPRSGCFRPALGSGHYSAGTEYGAQPAPASGCIRPLPALPRLSSIKLWIDTLKRHSALQGFDDLPGLIGPGFALSTPPRGGGARLNVKQLRCRVVSNFLNKLA